MKSIGYLAWSWITMFLFAGFVLWLNIQWVSSLPNLNADSLPGDEALKVLLRMFLTAIFFILLYRAIIVTFRNTVSRLSAWHSKREAIEDAEFVLVIETLVTIITILSSILLTVVVELAQRYVPGRNPFSGDLERDILISSMAALLTALVVYSMPVIGELEMAIYQKFKTEKHSLSKEKDNN